MVLYEMLTGRQLFGGETVSDTLAALLTKAPDLEGVPVQVRRLLRACLEKDPKLRVRDIGDVWRLLEDAPGYVRQRPWRWIAATAVFAVALAIPAAWFLKPKPRQPEQPLLQVEITAPEDTTFGPVTYGQLALSPDGRRLVFLATGKDGKRMLWMRPLGANSATALVGTENAAAPFWSPDNRWVGFFASGTLQKVDVTGGQPQVICPANSPATAGTWNSEGVILFAENQKPIQRVSASGGTPIPVLALDAARAETEQRDPYFLPDGQHLLYFSSGKETGVAFGSLDGKTHRFLFAQRNSPAWYASNPLGGGWLLYSVGGQFLARPFDARKGEFTGEAAVVTDSLFSGPSWSASANGLLAFRRIHGSKTQLTWFNRDGKRLGVAGDPGNLSGPRISPDQKTIVFSRSERRNSDLWLFDITRETTTRFTLESGSNNSPVWSPDGRRIIYASRRQNDGLLVERPANGIGPETIRESLPAHQWVPTAVSRDGHWLAVTEVSGISSSSIVLFSPVDGKSVPFLGPGRMGNTSFSPDGRWILYSSIEAGRPEVFVQSLPKEAGGSTDAVGKFQISNAGGSNPVWRADGKEIFYLASDGKLMAVPVESGVSLFRPGAPRPLFQTGLNTGVVTRDWDVTPDGQRFLINQRTVETGDTPITVIVNWPKLLQK